MTFHLPILVVGLGFGVPITLGLLYGLLLRRGYDPLGLTGETINAVDEPLKAAVDLKHERKAKREGDVDE